MMTTAPTTYTIELMRSPSSQADSQPFACGWSVDRSAPGAHSSMQGQIQPARRGLAVHTGLWKWGVGGAAGRPLGDGSAAIRPRSRSASDLSDGEGTRSADGGHPSFHESGRAGGAACRRRGTGRARVQTRPRFDESVPGGQSATGHRAARVPRRGPRAIRNRGGDPRFRTVRAELGVVSAPPPSGQPVGFTGRRPHRGA